MADLLAPLPMVLLRAGARVQFEAIDPTSGAAVAGVKISSASIYALDRSEAGAEQPLWTMFLVSRDA